MTDLGALLLATADDLVIDEGLRWCAAMGVSPEVARDVPSVRRSWRGAAAVLVGDDLAGDLARAALPRRDHVVLVADDPPGRWRVALELGAVAACRPSDEDRIIELLSAALDGRGEACVVSVVGGVGGAGASTVTVALGLSAARRRLRPLVLDADPLGGGLDLVLGSERADGLRWDDFGATRGRIGAGSLDDVLPTRNGVSSLTWRIDSSRALPQAWPEVLAAAVRGFDLIAVDVPRHLDEIGAEIVGRSVLTLLVVPEEIAAVAGSRQVLAGLQRRAPAVGLVTVGRSGGIGPAAVSEALEMPVLARIRPDRRLRGAVDRGRGPGLSRSLRRSAAEVLDAIGLEST